ncbi:DUF262 domain-containing protein [Dokdonia ponticola]|uniref:DUF262 domain-containing protein n=1 Tax=Dokdonia ponticola TaxID=2041041 RepID=A0ABV9HQ03_9FLAO
MTNYNLDTGKKYIKDIFSPECFYNIPEYQRPYVWGIDQIIMLLEDLAQAMESDDKKEYFLGCMIWNTKTIQENGLEYVCQDILDGQQRFITLYLLQGVIRDLSNDGKLKEKVTERMKQEEDIYDGVPERNRIIFEIRDDKDFLEEFLLTVDGTQKEDALEEIIKMKGTATSVKNMASAILIMRNWWQKVLKEKGSEDYQKYLKKYFAYLSSKVLAIFLATPDNLDDAYNLFTVLNSRGLQLQVSDILRAQNLRVIEGDSERKKYAKKWSSFEDNIGAPFRGFDDFLWSLVFIKMKYRSDDNQSLTKGFEFMWKRNYIKKGVSTFDMVGTYVDHYEAITDGRITTKETGELFSNLNFILTSVFGSAYMAPLLHYRELYGDYRIIDFIIKLDNLLTIPWLTGKRTSLTRTFIILRKMEEFKGDSFDNASIQQAADEFLDSEYLKYEYADENSNTALDINELFYNLENEKWGAYAGTRVNKTRYLLLKLDLLLGNFNTRVQFNKNNSSVEHIMPQKIANTEWDIELEEHENWIHRLGNLALIDRRKNASLSNRKFSDKKIRYQGAIETRANTNYIFMRYRDWNIDSISENHIRVVSILKDYYLGNSIETVLQLKKNIQNSDQLTKNMNPESM